MLIFKLITTEAARKQPFYKLTRRFSIWLLTKSIGAHGPKSRTSICTKLSNKLMNMSYLNSHIWDSTPSSQPIQLFTKAEEESDWFMSLKTTSSHQMGKINSIFWFTFVMENSILTGRTSRQLLLSVYLRMIGFRFSLMFRMLKLINPTPKFPSILLPTTGVSGMPTKLSILESRMEFISLSLWTCLLLQLLKI